MDLLCPGNCFLIESPNHISYDLMDLPLVIAFACGFFIVIDLIP